MTIENEMTLALAAKTKNPAPEKMRWSRYEDRGRIFAIVNKIKDSGIKIAATTMKVVSKDKKKRDSPTAVANVDKQRRIYIDALNGIEADI